MYSLEVVYKKPDSLPDPLTYKFEAATAKRGITEDQEGETVMVPDNADIYSFQACTDDGRGMLFGFRFKDKDDNVLV